MMSLEKEKGINPPEYHSHEEFQKRKLKLKEIREMGINPYPYKYAPTHTTKELKDQYEKNAIGDSEEAKAGATTRVCVVGRLVLFRAMGKNAFGHIQDETGRIQIMFNRDATIVESLDPKKADITHIKFIEKKIDLGDILGIEGHLFKTQKGEMTIFVKKVTLLCKSLLPLPDKHSGLADKGILYRKRWLDLLTNPESLERLKIRSKIIQITRNYLDEAGFLEVETPVLQNVYGGAQARPFETNLHALHQDMFLRISLEISLKKLLVGGIHKVYEMSKVFRNEGLDRTHNPEFTELEIYAAYWDYNDMMSFMEKLFEKIAIKLFDTTKLKFQSPTGEKEIELKAPWKRLTVKEAIKTYVELDVDKLSDEEIRKILLKQTPIEPKSVQKGTRGSLIAYLFEELVEAHLIQPHHIIDYPIETTPLCKLHRDPEKRKEGIVERFESYILGGEMINSYSELNDPELQRKLLEEQAEKKQAGDVEANPLDEEFIEAICQGMPPASGMGMGIDRLVMLFTNAASIRDVIYFPLMKPEE